MPMDRAYSMLEVKSIEDQGDKRVIRGVATTPTPDRMNDIVEPLGIEFKNPMPLLWQHKHDQPVGKVRFSKPTKDGIEFEAIIAKTDEPGNLKNRIDEAWQSVKLGLVSAVSIGFKAIELAFMDNGGIHFLKTEVMELSLVTIPANAEAVIQTIKSIDGEIRAASGNPDITVTRHERPGVTGIKPVKSSFEGRTKMKTIAEQIASFEATRAAKSARMEEIMNKAAEDGTTLDGEQSEEYDTLSEEVASIDQHLKRLDNQQKSMASRAKPITGSDPKGGSESRVPVSIKAPKQEPGIQLARYARCLGIAKNQNMDAVRVAESLYGDRDPVIVSMVKAAVPAASVDNATWAKPLVGDEGTAFADFVDFLRPMTILGRFGSGGVPSLRRVPFRVALITQSAGMSGYWVGEGKAKPLTKAAFSRTTIEPLKVANIAVATMETLRDSSPSAEMLIRDELAVALVAKLDTTFIDPTIAASAGVSPASITNGLGGQSIVSGGQDVDAIRDDVQRAIGKFITANNPLSSGVWVMSATTALSLMVTQNALGQPEFPGITMAGGVFFGIPVLVSEYVSGYAVLMNSQDIYLADDGGITVDMSSEASLEMLDSSLVGDSIGSTAAASVVSLWQTNSVAFRAERTINWMRRRATGVVLITGVSWGSGAS
jgi:HK97 family phage prohead protease